EACLTAGTIFAYIAVVNGLGGNREPSLAVIASPAAIMPGRITRAGKSIFGTAAINGVRRAALMLRAAMARCTTRKLVHQYPKERTNPSPNTIANQSTPIVLWVGPASSGCHALVQALEL